MKQNSKHVAVTGGIGSGKSTVCNIIKELGYRVYSCDEVYRDVLNDGAVIDELAENFGSEIVGDGHVLNRKKLADIVFADSVKLEKLNSITHPKIFRAMFYKVETESENLSEETSPMIFYEVPLLFEGGYQKLFDAVIVVERDKFQRIKSVSLRDNICEEEVKKRIKNQFNYENLNSAMYYVIRNSVNLSQLQQIVCELVKKIDGDLFG